MICILCGNKFCGQITCVGEANFNSKFCQTCYEIKGSTDFLKFLSHAKKIVAWQEAREEYNKSLNKLYPCAICKKEHLTRVGSSAICESCIVERKKRKDEVIALDKEKKVEVVALDEEKKAELAINQEKKAIIIQKITDIFRKDPTWTVSPMSEKFFDLRYFLKEEIRINTKTLSIELWDYKRSPNSRKNSWRFGRIKENLHRLPKEVAEIIKDNDMLF